MQVTKGNHQTAAEMQRANLFHYLAENTRQQRHTGTQALLGLAHPIESGRGAGGGRGHRCLPHSNKRLCAVCESVIPPQEFNFSKQAEDEQL